MVIYTIGKKNPKWVWVFFIEVEMMMEEATREILSRLSILTLL